MFCNFEKLKGINIPRDIEFEESKDKATLILTMKHVGIVGNMQDDHSAFEAWALLGKAKKYEKIKLNIESLNIEKKELGHYNRFLYRVKCFNELFDWFYISEELEKRINEFKNTYLNRKTLIYNVPTKSSKSSKASDKISEHVMENFFITHKDITNEKLGINAQEYFSQLPVGLFYEEKKDNNRIFTGKKSAIDFWSITDNILNIIELKIGDNNGLGVLSEIFFYTCLMRDIYIKKIAQPSNHKNNVRGFDKLMNTNIKQIRAFILLEEKHPHLDLAYNEIRKVSNSCKEIIFAENIIEYNHLDLL